METTKTHRRDLLDGAADGGKGGSGRDTGGHGAVLLAQRRQSTPVQHMRNVVTCQSVLESKDSACRRPQPVLRRIFPHEGLDTQHLSLSVQFSTNGRYANNACVDDSVSNTVIAGHHVSHNIQVFGNSPSRIVAGDTAAALLRLSRGPARHTMMHGESKAPATQFRQLISMREEHVKNHLLAARLAEEGESTVGHVSQLEYLVDLNLLGKAPGRRARCENRPRFG